MDVIYKDSSDLPLLYNLLVGQAFRYKENTFILAGFTISPQGEMKSVHVLQLTEIGIIPATWQVEWVHPLRVQPVKITKVEVEQESPADFATHDDCCEYCGTPDSFEPINGCCGTCGCV